MRQLEGNNLLIIDNVNSEVQELPILDQISLKPNWRVLVTSRERLVGFENYEIDFLSTDNAKLLFYLHYNREKDNIKLEELLKIIEYHTLAIELLAKTAQNLRLSITSLIQRLKEKGLDITDNAGVTTSHSQNQKIERIFAYILEIFDIADLVEEEKILLTHFSVFPPIYVDYDLLKDLLRVLISSPFGHDKFIRYLNNLVEKGFLSERDNTFYSHPIVSEVVRAKLSSYMDICLGTIRGIAERFVNNYKTDPLSLVIYLPFIKTLLKYIHSIDQDTINLYNGHHLLLGVVGNFEEKLLQIDRTIDLYVKYSKKTGEDLSFEIANCSNSKGETYRQLEQWDLALEHFQECLKVRRVILEPNHLFIAQSYDSIGIIYRNKNEPNDALEYQELARQIYEDHYRENIARGITHIEMLSDILIPLATNYNNLGMTHETLGNMKHALDFGSQSINIHEKFARNHPGLGTSYFNMSLRFFSMWKYDQFEGFKIQAQLYIKKCLEFSKEKYKKTNPNHPSLVKALREYDIIMSI